ncbi:esterase [Frondihabitans sp. VKM Ac-2883]|nr:esterase [Frondihabitans sp. VKM Ac-2883]
MLVGAGSTAALVVASGAAVEERLLPGRSTLHRVLGLNGQPGVVPAVETGQVVSGSFRSKARLGREVGWSVAYPPGSSASAELPVAIVLHGYSGTHANAFGAGHLGLDRFLAAHVDGGGRPFALASIDGGDTYWHRRSTGEDAGAMVVDEFLPLLAARGLDVSRIGLLGWSMGAFGALLLGSQLGRTRVAAIAADSPAIWHEASQAASIAFDGAADFAAHTVFGRQSSLDGIAVRVDCGTGDGFFPAARDYVAGFASPPAGGFEPGGHDLDYWRRMAPAQIAHLGHHLP